VTVTRSASGPTSEPACTEGVSVNVPVPPTRNGPLSVLVMANRGTGRIVLMTVALISWMLLAPPVLAAKPNLNVAGGLGGSGSSMMVCIPLPKSIWTRMWAFACAGGSTTMCTVRLTPAAVRVLALGASIAPSEETATRSRMQYPVCPVPGPRSVT